MIDSHYEELVRTILFHLQNVINDDISCGDYGKYPLIAYVNDSLGSLCEFLDIIVNYEPPIF